MVPNRFFCCGLLLFCVYVVGDLFHFPVLLQQTWIKLKAPITENYGRNKIKS